MSKSTGVGSWQKPYADSPLSYHPPSGRLYKKIRGRRHYVRYTADWKAAREKFQVERDDLFAGRALLQSGQETRPRAD